MFRNLFYVPLISFLLFSNFIISDEVEEVVVTGSYIKGSPTDGASPVELYDRTTIEAIGACLLYTSDAADE